MPLYPKQIDINRAYFLDDFCGAYYDNGTWAIGTSGTSSAAKIGGVGGILELIAEGGEYAVEMTFSSRRIYNKSQKPFIRWYIKCPDPTSLLLNIGFLDTSAWNNWVLWTADPPDHTNWRARASNGGSETVVDSGVAPNTSWHLCEILMDTGQCFYLLDGVLYATITTNLPTVNMTPYIYLKTLGANDRNALIDWIEMESDRAS